MKILIFAGSLRKDSCNKKLAREALRFVTDSGVDAKLIDLKDYPMPAYDGDIEENEGIPETTKALSREINMADALIISTPEYNGSIPGTLKNIIDWLSREKPTTITGKHLLIIAASPGALGGTRVIWHCRQPFEVLGVHVFPNTMGVPNAYNAFDESGKLKDEKIVKKLKETVESFVKYVGSFK